MSQDLTLTPAPPSISFEIWDEHNPRSVINLVPENLGTKFKEAKLNQPELFRMDERDLKKTLGGRKAKPSISDERLRCMFWIEHQNAQLQNRKMKIQNVWSGVCSEQYFYERYLKFPEKVAWLLTAPVSYAIALEETLLYTVEQMRDILDTPHVDKSGKLNLAIAGLKTRIWEKLHVMKYGAAVQRVEQKSVQMNVHTGDKKIAEALLSDSMEDIERRIKELEKLDKAKGGTPIQVDSEVIDP